MKKPNILWIMSDQHNANCFSFAGRNVKTPNLDKLAEKGVVFTRAYCNNPICAPSRISFITGQYPRTHRHLGNFIHIYPERKSIHNFFCCKEKWVSDSNNREIPYD